MFTCELLVKLFLWVNEDEKHKLGLSRILLSRGFLNTQQFVSFLQDISYSTKQQLAIIAELKDKKKRNARDPHILEDSLIRKLMRIYAFTTNQDIERPQKATDLESSLEGPDKVKYRGPQFEFVKACFKKVFEGELKNHLKMDLITNIAIGKKMEKAAKTIAAEMKIRNTSHSIG